MKSTIFNAVKIPDHKSSLFDLSHDHKTTIRMGEIVPFLCHEVIPGDKTTIGTEALFRMAPIIAPVMHRCNISIHHFFVPNRLVWSGWEDFITGNDENLVHPYINKVEGMNPASLGQYLGIPPEVPGTERINPFPLAAYFLIYDEWYRDQNLITEQFVELASGDNTSNYSAKLAAAPLKRAWEHDYFTSALPFAQKGDPVTLPLLENDNAVVELGDTSVGATQPNFQDGFGNDLSGAVTGATGDGDLEVGGTAAWFDPSGSLEVPINTEATTVNTLRRAFRLQEFLELAARTGTRYKEMLKAFFGVSSSDARLDRPEYIGGTADNIVFSEVIQMNSQNDNFGVDTPLGWQGGTGIGVSGGQAFQHFAEEHGYIISLVNVQPKTAYQDGLERHWSYDDRFDYFWRQFENIGEQSIANKEVYVGAADPDGEFGYIPRYSHLKFKNNRVSGQFRDELSFYHFGRIFGSEPALNQTFVECTPPRRPFANFELDGDLTDGALEDLYCQIYIHMKAVRRMAKYSTPSI